jgi:TonB family protein
MADPWVRPTSPGPPDPGVPTWPENQSRSAKVPSADDYLLIDRLREDAAMGRMDLDSILSEATHAARYFTDATGAALALWSQGVVICRARSGDTAPPLGAKLDVESGISGECLRSGRSKRCNDTLTDPLVDAQVCQELGIRSLAGVPLRGEHGVVGILEVFSDRPYAFSDAHITLLKQLAQVAVTGRSRSVPSTTPAGLKRPGESQVARPPHPTAAQPRREPSAKPSPFKLLAARMKGEEGQPLRLAAAGGLLVLVIGGFWWMSARGHKSSSPPQSVQAASSAVPSLMAASPPTETSLDVSSTFGNRGKHTRTLAPGGSSKPSPDVVANDLVRRASKSVVTDRNAPAEEDKPIITITPPRTSSNEDVPAPETAELGSGEASVPQSVLSTQHALPTVALRMSEGVTGGALTHRVSPTYPQQARMLRIEGAVQLDATVGEDGNVHDVKVVKGDRILALAAMQAVQQWRYQPFQLNGKPVPMHTQVTIQFKLP